MTKCDICGSTAGYKITSTDAVPVITYKCEGHMINLITETVLPMKVEKLAWTRKPTSFYGNGGYIG